jgi:hypothetical protein
MSQQMLFNCFGLIGFLQRKGRALGLDPRGAPARGMVTATA